MRQACHMRLRTAVYHWARVATQHDALSRRRYAALRQRGHSHGRALRTVADRLLAVACAMLKTQNHLQIRNMLSETAGLLDLRSIPWFDRSDHPFVPTLPPGRAPRAVEVTPKGAPRTGAPRRGAVDGTSTALHSKYALSAPTTCAVTAQQCPRLRVGSSLPGGFEIFRASRVRARGQPPLAN